MNTDLSLLLKRAERLIDAQLAAALRDENLSAEEWRVLDILSDGQGRVMSDLAAEAVFNLPALSKLVDRLVSRALLFRAPDQSDRRKVLVFVSDHGLSVYQRLQPDIQASGEALLANVSHTRVQQLKKLLNSFISDASPGEPA
ncbi:MarR family transcriptional regulator [Ferrovibrio sp.]|uniref:MarR family winged helix-turn-helix transcriptional regulator n=1 Tax=Ferrovibrio sp. TaxID=1917215 RepID=UPI001B5403EE|nr:MarR family transcriptional regulator [Ferrovibrio sp.]MBP7063180.1 MarR family transcriptional regulator [Ferrovibrio sp.]